MRELFFADAFYYKDIENSSEMNKDLISKILEWKHDDPEGVEISNSLGWQSRATMQKEKSGFADVTNKINEFLNEVWSAEQYNEGTALEITNMWANVNKKYSYNRYHEHPNSLWSGVYYVKTPNNCGKLGIKDPRAISLMTLPRYNKPLKSYQWRQFYYDAVAGRCIMFPAWLEHFVEPNQSNDLRISISFNFLQKK